MIPKSFSGVPKEKICGLTRGVDDVGRIVVPVEYRKELGLGLDSQVEMFLLTDGIFIRKKAEAQGGDEPFGE